MKQLIFTLLVLLIVSVFSCKQQSKITGSLNETVNPEVELMLKDYAKAYNDRDVVKAQSFIDDSEEFFWIFTPDKSPATSDAVKEYVKNEINRYRTINMSYYYIRVNPLSENLAVYTGAWDETSENHKGDIEKFFGVETGVVVKRNGVWKFLNGQTCAHQELTEVK